MLNIRDNIRITKYDKQEFRYEIALAGNPNVGKSTIFNALTGLKQHTGNWSGKTVSNAIGYYKQSKNTAVKVVDLPGTYSLNANSQEEIIAKEYIESKCYDCIVVVADATNIERNLSLVLQILQLTQRAVLCLNLYDEAQKAGVIIDADELSLQLGIPVVCTCANEKSSIVKLRATVDDLVSGKNKTYAVQSIIDTKPDDYEAYIENIYSVSTSVCSKCVYMPADKDKLNRKIDKLLTQKSTGIPIMLALLGIIFWITIVGANYLSDLLCICFDYIKNVLLMMLSTLSVNSLVLSFIVDGVYTTLAWVVAVMLPPMAIFFPLFSLLEDSGYLPRIAYNLDGCFSKSGAHGKQALTMAMGFGCNACGVMGCRIIDSQREKSIAILTNSFMPCNGKLPSLIVISSIFIATTSLAFINSVITAGVLLLLIIFAVAMTLITSKVLSSTILKGQSSSFILELPPYRKPQIIKTIIYSLKNRALFVLLRAIAVALPAGAVIWCFANIEINSTSLLEYCSDFLEPVGNALGLDGVIIMAFILGFPANETVIPIMLMSYTSGVALTDYNNVFELGAMLTNNGWTLATAICFIIMCMFHFPCSTTTLTIYKETKSIKLTILSLLIPTIIGVALCFVINCLFSLI